MRGKTWQQFPPFLPALFSQERGSANRLGLCFLLRERVGTPGGGRESVGGCWKQVWATALVSRDSLPIGPRDFSQHQVLPGKSMSPSYHNCHSSSASPREPWSAACRAPPRLGQACPSPVLPEDSTLPRIWATASSPSFPLPHLLLSLPPTFLPPFLSSFLNKISLCLIFWIVNTFSRLQKSL